MMPDTALSREQVETIMGRLDDLKVAEIIETGASANELLEAKRWSQGYLRTVSDDAPVRPTIVNRLCEIMGFDEPDWYDADKG